MKNEYLHCAWQLLPLLPLPAAEEIPAILPRALTAVPMSCTFTTGANILMNL